MMCLNWKIVGGLAAVAAAVLIITPSWFGVAGPILIVAACPLSMLYMMTKNRDGNTATGCTPAQDDAEVDRLRTEVAELRQELADRRSRNQPA